MKGTRTLYAEKEKSQAPVAHPSDPFVGIERPDAIQCYIAKVHQAGRLATQADAARICPFHDIESMPNVNPHAEREP